MGQAGRLSYAIFGTGGTPVLRRFWDRLSAGAHPPTGTWPLVIVAREAKRKANFGGVCSCRWQHRLPWCPLLIARETSPTRNFWALAQLRTLGFSPTTNFWALAQLRTLGFSPTTNLGLKPNYEPWAKAQLGTFGLKPNYELLAL